MKRENITREEALAGLRKDDHERRQWSLKLYGIDSWDASLYDLVVHLHKLRQDDAVKLICEASRFEQFHVTPESHRVLQNLLLAAQVKAKLVDEYPIGPSQFHRRSGDRNGPLQRNSGATACGAHKRGGPAGNGGENSSHECAA